ncbi:Thioredoxin C-1 [Rubripirellula lacrimiformis]|uniref:Thioredoxin C-1 n=1 Tax=Rubripirellula lacrimiformis TaxID=1930273 RepID=A0A517NCW8_9BACT|nr:thioredoxin family protein [Rubripirellula lacrimiformis]QDT04972.1 Thioredoxin C-1 [Rubripirellula lacrimiformis]
MKINSLVLFIGILTTVATFVGCTDARLAAFRSPPSEDFSTPIVSQEVSVETVSQPQPLPVAGSSTGDTLVTTSSAQRPVRPSLITLSAGDDLAAKVNAAGGPVLLDFYADWCGPCQHQGQILHEVEETAARRGALMIKINIDDHPEIARDLNVEGIPTLILVKDGKIEKRQSGVADKDRLLSWLQ